MRFQIDHDYHIHSQLSTCSGDPEQTPQRILQYAKENGLTSICLTDHYWDAAVPGASPWYAPQDFDHIAESRPLPQAEGIEFLFGCETDLRKELVLGLPMSRFDEFDFVIIPTTHLHMNGFTIAEEDLDSTKRRAQLWVERLEAVLDMDLPFGKIGIAHLACGLIYRTKERPREKYLETLRLIPDDDLERVFTKAAKVGCGIELQQYDMAFAPHEEDTVLRPFRVAKACGCKFYLGSDSHCPSAFAKAKETLERAVTKLELREEDKFHIERTGTR